MPSHNATRTLFTRSNYLLCALCVSAASPAFAGPLAPPIGPIAPTPGPEPRIAINATNTPGDADSIFKITQPGSYYLTGNITGLAGENGIEIAASGVTLDLNGFEVIGVAGSLDGIRDASIVRNVTVRNGSIRNWGENGVQFTFNGTTGCHFERLLVSNNTGTGIGVSSPACSFTECTVVANGSFGISASTGAKITSCIANENVGNGIFASQGSTVIGCTAFVNGLIGIGVGFGCTVVNCTADDNTSHGFEASNGTTITNCTALGNNGSGFFAFTGVTIRNCTAYQNTLNGIDVSTTCVVENCLARSNVLDGIECGFSCIIRGNACTSNGASAAGIGAGIHATGSDTRVEGNNCTSNDFGIDIDAGGNVIIRNTCANNTQNFIIAANNIHGTIADRTAPASPAVIGNSAAGTMGSSDPNANYAY